MALVERGEKAAHLLPSPDIAPLKLGKGHVTVVNVIKNVRDFHLRSVSFGSSNEETIPEEFGRIVSMSKDLFDVRSVVSSRRFNACKSSLQTGRRGDAESATRVFEYALEAK